MFLDYVDDPSRFIIIGMILLKQIKGIIYQVVLRITKRELNINRKVQIGNLFESLIQFFINNQIMEEGAFIQIS